MLERGEVDERAFLPDEISSLLIPEESVDPLIGLKRTPQKNLSSVDTDHVLRLSVQSCLEKVLRQSISKPVQ